MHKGFIVQSIILIVLLANIGSLNAGQSSAVSKKENALPYVNEAVGFQVTLPPGFSIEGEYESSLYIYDREEIMDENGRYYVAEPPRHWVHIKKEQPCTRTENGCDWGTDSYSFGQEVTFNGITYCRFCQFWGGAGQKASGLMYVHRDGGACYFISAPVHSCDSQPSSWLITVLTSFKPLK